MRKRWKRQKIILKMRKKRTVTKRNRRLLPDALILKALTTFTKIILL
jgi:hypothetical protein